jgi:hypothetical protein
MKKDAFRGRRNSVAAIRRRTGELSGGLSAHPDHWRQSFKLSARADRAGMPEILPERSPRRQPKFRNDRS